MQFTPDAGRLPEQHLGRPHLTWIFVAPLAAGHGIGTALHSNATTSLLNLGYKELASTFLAGNVSSTLWHWRNGFELLEYPGSYRSKERRIGIRYYRPAASADRSLITDITAQGSCSPTRDQLDPS